MNQLMDALVYLSTAANWTGDSGFLSRTVQHLGYSALAVTAALLIAAPLGIAVGHFRRGANFVMSIAGALRALPALGVLTWLAIAIPGGVTLALLPATLVLVVLAVSPLLAGIVAGFDSVPQGVIHAARASGYNETQILTRVELPLAAPLIVGGLRSCIVQVIATATVVSYIGLGGLGRFLIDGLALQDYPRMVAGAIVVTTLALIVDLILAMLQRLATPPGLKQD